jgi:DNA-directed RNA polymerase II subunit RPB1
MMAVYVDPVVKDSVDANIALLESALIGDVLWDEIVELVYLEDPKTYVYDFTVPGNDSFMVDDNVLVHNTLNTFHLAGVSSKSNMTRGVPRLKEMLKVTKNPKATALTVYLKPSFRENKDRVREVAQDLELTVMKDIVNRVAAYYDPTDEASVLEEDRELLKFYEMFESRETATDSEEATQSKWSKWLLRLEFDRETMFNRNITIDDVNFVLADKFTNQINMIYSDFNSQRLVMRIRLATGDNTYGDDLVGIKKLQNRILNNIVIRGLPGIRSASFRKDKDKKELIDGEYKAIEQYVLDTDGSNFIEVMNHPAVDGNKIYSTNVHDIYQQLGIEAARSALFQEINVLFAEAGINYRHMGLLCDWMTRIGRFMTVDRYGINKNDTGPLSKASFEETERVMLKAALYGEIDPVTGISANIMTGQPLRGGTAFTQILLDEFALPRLMEGLPAMEEAEEEEDAPQQENIDNELYEDTNDACAATNLRMNLEMPATIQENNEEDIEITVLDAE